MNIVWFREDLRLADNPALSEAAKGPLLCLYIFDEQSAGIKPLGGAARWRLHHALQNLADGLAAIGARLDIYLGRADRVLEEIVQRASPDNIYWNRRYARPAVALDAKIKTQLSTNANVKSFKAKLLVEPWECLTQSGQPYKVFTPFWRTARSRLGRTEVLPAPTKLRAGEKIATTASVTLESLDLLPHNPNWASKFDRKHEVGEVWARQACADFLDGSLEDYPQGRDNPGEDKTSHLSAALAMGEISARQIYLALQHRLAECPQLSGAGEKFLSEIFWREFCWSLFYHFPDLGEKNFNETFDAFDWPAPNEADIRAWRRGRTGYPIVDAGMRELWATGFMHNRVRMVTASFLIKHLLTHWRTGEQWFWDTLCDADEANNAANWQWVAGCGADAAPYFRIFNPILQGEKFDAAGVYVRRWIPEIAKLPNDFIHRPWAAPPMVLSEASVILGQTYPAPIVDHSLARTRALNLLGAMRARAYSEKVGDFFDQNTR